MYKLTYADGTIESFETREEYLNTLNERYDELKKQGRLDERMAFTLTCPDGSTMELFPL